MVIMLICGEKKKSCMSSDELDMRGMLEWIVVNGFVVE